MWSTWGSPRSTRGGRVSDEGARALQAGHEHTLAHALHGQSKERVRWSADWAHRGGLYADRHHEARSGSVGATPMVREGTDIVGTKRMRIATREGPASRWNSEGGVERRRLVWN